MASIEKGSKPVFHAPEASTAAHALLVDNESLEVVDTLAGFEALKPEWQALSGSDRHSSVFMEWDWHHAWWQIFASSHDRLHIITLRREQALVAVLPMYRKRSRLSMGPSLHLIGTGEARAEEVATEYGDLLMVAGLDEDTRLRWASCVMQHLVGFSDWYRVNFMCLLNESWILRAARRSEGSLTRIESPAGRRYRARLADGEDAHFERMGASRGRRILRSRKAAEKCGGLTRSSLVETPDGTSHFDELVRLNNERLDSRGKRSSFSAVRFEEFHRELIRRWGDTGRADVICYDIGGATRAAIYCFADGHTCHYYQSGFSLEGANRFMPLTLAHLTEMQHRRNAGYQWYDLMRGTPPSYKEEFGCESEPMWNLSMYRSARARRIHLLFRRYRAWLVRVLADHNITRNA